MTEIGAIDALRATPLIRAGSPGMKPTPWLPATPGTRGPSGPKVCITATPEDPQPMGPELFAAVVSSPFGPIPDDVPPQAAPPAVCVPFARRQLLIAFAAAGSISAEEALAAAPAVPASIFDLLPAAQALAARITWATMNEVYRQDPLTGAIVARASRPPSRSMNSFAWRRGSEATRATNTVLTDAVETGHLQKPLALMAFG